MNEQEILNKRNIANTAMNEMLDAAAKAGGMLAENRSRYEALEKEFDDLSVLLEDAKKAEARRKILATPNVDSRMLGNISDSQPESRNATHAEAFSAYLRNNETPEQRSFLSKETRAQSVGTPASGGFLVTPT